MTTLFNQDCFDRMEKMKAESIHAIIADLPYGTTNAPWDQKLSTSRLWACWRRLLTPGGTVILTACQPFTSELVYSNLDWFRCEWIWDKVNGANFANANRQPLKTHESVLVFCERQPVYHPQKTAGLKNHAQGKSKTKHTETQKISARSADDLSGMKFPKSIQQFPKHSSQSKNHSTEKPVALLEYFIRTYTSGGNSVLDCTMGSGSTGVACVNTGRNFFGIEVDPKYFAVAERRISAAFNEDVL